MYFGGSFVAICALFTERVCNFTSLHIGKIHQRAVFQKYPKWALLQVVFERNSIFPMSPSSLLSHALCLLCLRFSYSMGLPPEKKIPLCLSTRFSSAQAPSSLHLGLSCLSCANVLKHLVPLVFEPQVLNIRAGFYEVCDYF